VSNPRRRSRALLVAVLFVFSIFAAQLLRIQGFEASAYRTEAAKQYTTGTRDLPAQRGSILDALGQPLANSVERRTVVVDQQSVCIYKTANHLTCTPDSSGGALDAAAADLAPLIGQPAATIRPKLEGSSRYRIIAKGVTPLAWRKIAALGIPGITSETGYQRIYPSSTTAASLVGFVGDNDQGLEGIEKIYDSTLNGKPGSSSSEFAGLGARSGADVVAPQPGRDVRLTINGNIQWYAQNSLAQMVRKTQATSGTVIVEDVRTGKLLAVASYPTYDPANRKDLDLRSLQNTAFTETFEPGSTSKIMTMAAAIEEGKVTPSTPVIIPSQIRRVDRIFHDSHPHGTEFRTVAGTLAESSNMGTIFVGETMTAQVLDTYLRKFGLGKTSGIDFIGESAGELHPWDKQDGAQRYTVMFGQGVSVTAIQVASVFQTIANGGLRIPPRLVDAVEDPSGAMRETAQPQGVRVVSNGTAHQVSQMLEGVVSEEGTAPKAKIDGYRVAGKTGTADRINPATGSYAGGGKTGSFVGYAPADNPRLVVAVILQKPVRGYAGGVVAAPVFHDVMTYALQELGIPPTGTKPPTLTTRLESIDPGAPGVLHDRSKTTGR
jgi:cell division protein FtsI (penicillin-binding protein 3)